MNRLVICTVMNFNALCILKHDNLILLFKFRSLVPCANRSVDKSKWDVSYLFSFVVLEHPLLAVLAQVHGGDLVDDLVLDLGVKHCITSLEKRKILLTIYSPQRKRSISSNV